MAHYNLGVLLANMGRTDEAITHFRKALELNPNETSALKYLAFALSQKGQWTEAILVLQNALASARSAGDEARVRMIEQIYRKLHENRTALGAH
jgi:tetratricopeptide (TPR) repeat protein